MFPLRLGSGDEPLRLLCVGAHADDIEIGCGGTLARLFAERPNTEVRWCVFSADARRRAEAEASARDYLDGNPADSVVDIHDFREGFFPAQIGAIKEEFERLKGVFQPELILTHYRDDLHQDHRVLSELTYNTFRDHLIWEYEIPKYDGDLGNPNLFLALDEAECRRKVTGLLDRFVSQRGRDWFTADTFMAMLRLRGVGCHAPSGFAEAFYCRKAVLSPGMKSRPGI
jgi:LmbE family N-acetylglucosaminyl deacetylase